jgi:hypothetical protein
MMVIVSSTLGHAGGREIAAPALKALEAIHDNKLEHL